MPRPDPVRAARLRKHLSQKGMEVNHNLTQLLSNMNATLATMKLPGEEKPGEKPHERLRRFLDQIARAQRRLDTEQFGLCVACQQALPALALDEAPWTEQCADCARKEREGLV